MTCNDAGDVHPTDVPPTARNRSTSLHALAAAVLCVTPVIFASTLPAASLDQTDLDAFMATVLKHRDDNWRRLHDYILREKEVVVLDGPGRTRLYGSEREFSWYMRDGYLIRSPVRYNKVTLGESERRKYEEEWLKKEKEREAEHAKKAAERAARARSAEDPPVMDVESFVREGGEPRFISEAYFLEFKFEPGNYYLVGRETLDNREVLRIEYYPTRLFDDNDDRDDRDETDAEREKRMAREREIEQQMNKTSLVTLWVDPKARQIVKFTFENVDFGFLPGRWLLRVGEVKASMAMSQPFPNVWLPRALTFEGEVTLAVGTYEATYTREYFDYRQGEVRAKIRHYGPSEKD